MSLGSFSAFFCLVCFSHFPLRPSSPYFIISFISISTFHEHIFFVPSGFSPFLISHTHQKPPFRSHPREKNFSFQFLNFTRHHHHFLPFHLPLFPAVVQCARCFRPTTKKKIIASATGIELQAFLSLHSMSDFQTHSCPPLSYFSSRSSLSVISFFP